MSKMNNDVKAEKTSKNWGYRFFAVLLIAICALVAVMVPFKTANGESTLLDLVQAMFAGSNKAFGIIPTIAEETTMGGVYTVAAYLFTVFVAIAAVWALFAFFIGKKAPKMARTALFFLVLGALIYTAAYAVWKSEMELYSLVIAVAGLILFIILVATKNRRKPTAEEIREEAIREATSGFRTEEYAEAYPYEGGPVAGVLMAEEVNPSFLPHEPHVNTAGYDFYNCKSFDPFIATLDMAERNEFTELFILKFKGTMPELPDYDVGGDNKEFFRKLFIYLGQYRDRMSQPLLMKMYQYSMKI